LDLADPATAVTAVSRVLAGIDPARCAEVLVFNNAGRLDPIGPVWAKPVDEVLAHLNVNLSSAILVLSEVMRHFRDSPGRKLLVNVSSGAALKAYAGWSLYGTAKAGMEAFIRGLAVEERHQPRPFVAVSVDPGVIDTGMQALIRDTSAQDFPEVLRFVRRYEAGGLVPADTVAAAILELVARDDLESGARYDAPLAAA
ncbi:SDR family NAD(P)-dependent oxidoreductase, partial [Rubrivivax gelatinosus]